MDCAVKMLQTALIKHNTQSNNDHNPSQFFLIDASNVFFRGYSAAPELTAPDGFPTGGLHSFFQMLYSIEKKYTPDHILLVDKGKSFRSEIFEEYKAHMHRSLKISKTVGRRYSLV